MYARFWFAVALLVAAGGISSIPRSATATAAQQSDSHTTSTLADQNELALTVYNSDLALVRDVRTIQLPARRIRSAVHGYRGDRQSGNRPLPIAHRAGSRLAFSSRTTSTTCSSRTSCCGNMSAAK